jgi:hypothetical protein
MIHFLTQYLGPKDTGKTQVMLTACGKKAVTRHGVEEGQTLKTADNGDQTCPGCAESMQVARLRSLRLREDRDKQMESFADKDDWRTNANDDPSLGEHKSTDGFGPAESADGMGPIEDTGP